MNEDFYTFSTYIKNEDNIITASMEDYIEMIYRLSNGEGVTRVSSLSQALNVQAPSTSKMMKKLSELGMVNYEPYGYIELTNLGNNYGVFLMNRHKTIEKFFSFLGVKHSILETTEKIEHL
ncbi:metal-dependent transcriptional regulator, partial [Clostridium tarantellae]